MKIFSNLNFKDIKITKKKAIVILLVVFAIFKTHSIMSNRIDLKPQKIYELNTLPDVCTNIKAGGFSDLYFKNNKLYIITDRGANSDFYYEKEQEARMFHCHDVAPTIYTINLNKNGIKVSGKANLLGVSGLPIDEYHDCTPTNRAEDVLPFDINGVDSESMIIDKKGNYWIGEEYYPSILKVNKDYKVEKRFAPVNSPVKNPNITYNLPEELNNINKNLGFEAMVYDGKNNIYVFTQSVLKNDIYGKIIKFNIKKEKVEKVYDYSIDENSIISGAVFINKNTILTVEKRNGIHEIRSLKLNKKVVKSKKIYTLTGLNKIGFDTKIEGIASGNGKLYIVNDNDYGINKENRKDNFIIEFKLR